LRRFVPAADAFPEPLVLSCLRSAIPVGGPLQLVRSFVVEKPLIRFGLTKTLPNVSSILNAGRFRPLTNSQPITGHLGLNFLTGHLKSQRLRRRNSAHMNLKRSRVVWTCHRCTHAPNGDYCSFGTLVHLIFLKTNAFGR
jgi:hypothetical protein